MNDHQAKLLKKADDSIGASQVLLRVGYPGKAVSQAYYAMFYAASAVLWGSGRRFKKHSSLIGAFGHENVKTANFPVEFHRWMIDAFEARVTDDYRTDRSVDPTEARKHIERAETFLRRVREYLKAP